ncbi:MAG: glycosyltransferase [Anaerolineales bacterium]|jgi:glycosyltransferase involved in cell wall biosynthesis
MSYYNVATQEQNRKAQLQNLFVLAKVKKVYFLIRSIGIGGAERQLCLLASELQKNGYQTKIITIYGSGSSEAEPKSIDINITSLGRRNRWDLSFFIKLFALIKKEKPDILHSYLQIANIAAALVKILFPRIKVVWGIRASYVDTSQYGCLVQITQKVHDHLNKMPDYIIFNSQAGMKYAAGLGYPKEKSCVIQNGIDTKRFFPDREAGLNLRQNWRVDANLKLIGMVARIDPQKDYPNFLNAAALLAKERSDIRFVCVGDGPEKLKREYWQLSHRLGLDSVLIWAGEQKDMLSIYNALDILVLSSYGEGFPNVIGEAMACGVPCVATNVGDAAQLIGHLGEIVPPKDPEALKQGIIALLDRLEHKEIDLRAQTRQRILEQFSVANLFLQTANIFEQILSKNS